MVLIRGSTGISEGTSHCSISPISAGVRLLTAGAPSRGSVAWETTGHGIIRPRRWPAAPLDSIPPPKAKRRATRGATSDGPSIRRWRPQGFALPCGRRRDEAALPLTSQPCRRPYPPATGTSRSEGLLPRFHLPSGVGVHALGTASRCSPAYHPALPPPVSASDRNITIRRIASISHPTCFVRFGFWPASASTLTTSCMSTRHAICKPGPLLAHNQKVVNNLPLCIPHSPTPAQNPQTVHAS